MRQLTYADRELLLQTFDSLEESWDGADDLLLAETCEFARRLAPRFGFEHALIRDITALSRYLLNSSDNDIAHIARGGLLYAAQTKREGPTRLGEFGLIDTAFVAGYAVHEIRTRLGEPALYSPPRLVRSEQDRAESLFLSFLEKPTLPDDELVRHALTVGSSLAGLAHCGFLRRLCKNIEFLISVLKDSQRSAEHRAYARGALAYLVYENDAIDDRLGIIGYLDDNFIAQLAVDFIEPAREPWLELLDATIGAWPFLNNLVIDDGSSGRPLSEYAIVNSALSCPKLRNGEHSATMLIAPSIGPTPFILGFVAALGLANDSRQRDFTEDALHPGQKVLVDGCAVAEFDGFETSRDGRRMFRLKQYHMVRRERCAIVHSWPFSDLSRLAPADAFRALRGELVYDLARRDVPIPAVDYLFSIAGTRALASVNTRVLVVTSVTMARAMARSLSFCGYPLKDVIPMGQLAVDQEVSPWSSRFGKQMPLLVVVPDLDSACACAEQNPDENTLVVVDASGPNFKKTASLQRLMQFNIRTLVVAEERTADELNVAAKEQVDVWEWSAHDFDSLLWPEQNGSPSSGLIARHEHRLQAMTSAIVNTRTVSSPSARRAFEAVRDLRRLASVRGEERLEELDEMLTLAFGITSLLLRCAIPLTTDLPLVQEIEFGLRKVDRAGRESLFLSQSEKAAVATAHESLNTLLEKLCQENPKHGALREILLEDPMLAVVCPDQRLHGDLKTAVADHCAGVIYDSRDDDACLAGAVIPGWFRKDRMSNLLMPPITSPLFLILYDIEHDWYIAYRHERQKFRKARRSCSHRARVFPAVLGWSGTTEQDMHPEDGQLSGFRELEAIQQHVQAGYRQRVYKSAQSDGTEVELAAHLVLFDGGTHAFLTGAYRANVVTHLLDAEPEQEDEKADIRQCSVSELTSGDALLFHRGSGRDVIRAAADQILPPGVRDLSSLWRKALTCYVTKNSIDSATLWKRLRAGGCPLQHQTIKIWLDSEDVIAPQSYSRDVEIIAQVTGDPDLIRQMDDVLAAIAEVRSAHLRASCQLAKKIIAQAVILIRQERQHSSLVEIEANVVMARIMEMDEHTIPVRTSLVNRLLEGEQ